MPSYDEVISVLEETGDFRVLRRLVKRERFHADTDEQRHVGIILDVETTGLKSDSEVIELGMVKFEYGNSGLVYRVVETFNQLQQPSGPIPSEVTNLTGITDEDVAGKKIDERAVKKFVKGADFVIAHNANFDRPLCESCWPVFTKHNWACSMSQIPWKKEGHGGTALTYLLYDYGYFHNGHRAADDCHAVLTLIASPLRTTKKYALTTLLETAARPTVRLWAENSPFESKDTLKARNYRWSPTRKSWYIVLDEELVVAELAFLSENVYRRKASRLPIDKIQACDRFSPRVNPN